MRNIYTFLLLIFSTSLMSVEFMQSKVDHALSCIQHPNKNWVQTHYTTDGQAILDVAIIGGGQTGLTMAFSLKRHCIHNICVFDKSKEDNAGAWINIGRMKTLRTPKSTTGPDLDIPTLSVKYWYSEKYGVDSWESLDYIPRLVWHEYLNWFRRVLKLPVDFESNVGPLNWDPVENCYCFTVVKNGIEKEVYARKVILATGLEGSGGWMIPSFIKNNRNYSAHA